MVTEYEARQLQREMSRELAGPTGAVWTCAAGMLVLVLVALLGATGDLQGTAGDTTAQAAGPSAERRM